LGSPKIHFFKTGAGGEAQAVRVPTLARHWWFTRIILATQEAEIGGSWFEASLGKEFKRPYFENTHHKKRTGRVAQDILLNSNPSIAKTKQKKLHFFSLKGERTQYL
jgi:hypothetical protein